MFRLFGRNKDNSTQEEQPAIAQVSTFDDLNQDVENQNIQGQPIAVANLVPSSNVFAIGNPTILPVNEALPEEDASYAREKVLLNLFVINRFIRVVTIIDVVFIIIFGLFSPIFFLLIPFPLCGYYGARKWTYKWLFIYALYLCLEIIGGVISIIYLTNTTFLVIRIIYLLINLLILRYVFKLCSFILAFEESDFEFLRNSPAIQNTERSLIC